MTATPSAFEVTVTGTYPTRLAPSMTATTTVHVPRVSPEQAPKAMYLLTRHQGEVSRTSLRTHGGRLYTAFTPSGYGVEPGSEEFPSVIRRTYLSAKGWEHTDDPAQVQAQHAAHAQADTALLLIVGDYLWVEIGEPRYVAHHFPGVEDAEHGGATLTVTMEDEPEIPAGAFFRADQFEQAWAHVLNLANRAGDTAAISYLHRHRRDLEVIEVLRPEAVTLVVPERAPREVADDQQTYASALMVLAQTADPEEEERSWSEAAAARSRIVAAGFSPLAVDSRPVEGRDT